VRPAREREDDPVGPFYCKVTALFGIFDEAGLLRQIGILS
jgi:hypothetical protein